MNNDLIFINPAVIERLEQGQFVPTRQAPANKQLQDRRNRISPLAVTKRCVRYDPNVFRHRKAYILQIAKALNQPEKKITLVAGPQGCGKTSLIRGLIELMGSRDEQLLWFDVNRHTDFDEIIEFLIQYITYVCMSSEEDLSGFRRDTLPVKPLEKLEALLNQVQEMPLLIVLDNLEYLVDPELRFNSYPFKEMLNFLLAFPNIKMILIGERLPYADISPNQEGIEDIKLKGLEKEHARSLIRSRNRPDTINKNPDPGILEQAAAPEAELAALEHLYRKVQGHPWLLKMIFQLHHNAELDLYAMNRLLESEAPQANEKHPPIGPLVRLILDRLPEQHRKLLQTLCFIRHPVSAEIVLTLSGVCYPVLGPTGLTTNIVEEMLEHSLLRPLLKISYPPQEVLAHIRNRKQRPTDDSAVRKFRPGYELYHQIKRLVHVMMPAEERERIHSALQDFYLREKSKEAEQRTLPLKNRALIAEAKHHGSGARNRKPAETSSLSHWQTQVRPESVSSKAPTLDDYRRIQIPEADSPILLPDEGEENLDGPTFLEILAKTETTQIMPDTPEPIELTLDAEEERLLKESNSAESQRLASLEKAETVVVPKEPSGFPKTKPSTNSVSPKTDLRTLTAGLLTESGSQVDERERRIQKALAAAVAAQDQETMLHELLNLAQVRANQGNYDSGKHCLEKALSLKSEAPPEVLAEIYLLRGIIHKEMYRHNAALNDLHKAVSAISRLMYEDETVHAIWMDRMGQVYQNLGEIQSYRQNHTEALALFQQALRWYHSADDELREAEMYFQIANIHDDLGQAQEAIHAYEQALKLDESNHNSLSSAAALANLGSLYQELGEAEKALTCMKQALDYDRQSNNTEGQLNTLEQIAELYMDSENWPMALQACQQALTLAMREGGNIWKAALYMKLGQIHTLRKDFAEALKYYELARSIGEHELSDKSLAHIDARVRETQKRLKA